MNMAAVPNLLSCLIYISNVFVSSSVHTVRIAIDEPARSYNNFPGLFESTADRKRGATLHGQRKCSQADYPRGYRFFRESGSKAVTRERARCE